MMYADAVSLHRIGRTENLRISEVGVIPLLRLSADVTLREQQRRNVMKHDNFRLQKQLIGTS
jgi:hypothetical protein